MTLKLIAVAGIGLLAGACSLRPLGMPVAYSSLPAENAPVESAVKTSAHPVVQAPVAFGPMKLAPSPAMPGDLVGSVSESRGVRIDPVAALSASALARSHWETLRPGNLTRAPLLQSRLAAALGAIGRTDVQTGSVATAHEMAPLPAVKTLDYDRDAAMARLLKGGRNASAKICDGC